VDTAAIERKLLLQAQTDLTSGAAIVLQREGQLFVLHVPRPSVFYIETALINGAWMPADTLLKDPQVTCFKNSIIQQEHGTWLTNTIIQDIISLEEAGHYFPIGNTYADIRAAYMDALATQAAHKEKAQQQAVVDFEARLDVRASPIFPPLSPRHPTLCRRRC
jgi:hypothetical protein